MNGVAEVVGTWFLNAAAPESFTLSGVFCLFPIDKPLDLRLERCARRAMALFSVHLRQHERSVREK
jgi:hypothetical protein